MLRLTQINLTKDSFSLSIFETLSITLWVSFFLCVFHNLISVFFFVGCLKKLFFTLENKFQSINSKESTKTTWMEFQMLYIYRIHRLPERLNVRCSLFYLRHYHEYVMLWNLSLLWILDDGVFVWEWIIYFIFIINCITWLAHLFL